MSEKISIIIPVYNTEKYIERCIKSILQQTYTNLEIICIDDDSTDNSGEILDHWAIMDDRVKVFHKKHEGVSAARNFGLHKVTGEYIGFIDSDDYVEREMYHVMIKEMQGNSIDVVTCNYNFDYNGIIKRAECKKEVPQIMLEIENFLPYMYERDTYSGVASYLWTRLVKKDLVIDHNGRLKIYFKEMYGGADDIVFVAELSMQSKTIKYIDKPLYNYFQRAGSIVHDNATILKTLHWVKAYEEIIALYQRCGVDSRTIDLVKRMYVYRCGKTLEIALLNNDADKIGILKEKIRNNLQVYIDTNLEHNDRIQWIRNLILS